MATRKTSKKRRKKLSFLPVPVPDGGRIVLGIVVLLMLYFGIPFGNPMTVPELWRWLLMILLGVTLYDFLKRLLVKLFEEAI